jgi:hypothetical protein
MTFALQTSKEERRSSGWVVVVQAAQRHYRDSRL